jgi:nucleoside-diphosphate-sugar epimerase
MENYGILPLHDIKHVSQSFSSEFQELESANFIIVGASGFLGRWLATSLAFMQSQGVLQGTLFLLVRNKSKISELDSLIDSPKGKIVTVASINESTFLHLNGTRTVVIYAASSTQNSGKPLEVNPESYLDLPRKILNHLPKQNVVFVHLSSGAVYNPSSRLKAGIPGSEEVQVSSADSYSAEKIILERWSKSVRHFPNLLTRNPRLFAFYGPGLQLDRHFAIGEFIRNGMSKLPIIIKGNPSNLRSYLHPRDATLQIFANCLLAEPINTQIGSSNVMTIKTVAQVIAREFGVSVEVRGQDSGVADNYVPLDCPALLEKNFEVGISEWRRWLEVA